jgi:hypothetical protein
VPVAILPALPRGAVPPGFVLEKIPEHPDKIIVTGPDGRVFLFSAGTSAEAINNYMQKQCPPNKPYWLGSWQECGNLIPVEGDPFANSR